jgi:hypothetical protein
MRTFLAFAFAGLAALTSAFAAPSAAQVLDAFRTANGEAPKGKTVLAADYDMAAFGMTGTVHVLTDFVTGHTVSVYKLGSVSGSDGYDGVASWDMDSSGTVTLQQGGDAKELTINQTYRDTNTWWRADRGGAKIALGEKTEAGKTYDVLTITPPGGKPFDAWFDRDSKLLVKIVEVHGSKTSITQNSDYAEYQGVKLPRTVVTDNGDGENYKVKMTLTKLDFLLPQPESAYAPPKTDMRDFEISGGAAQTVLPVRLINNHIYGDVKINGKGPFTAIFDTGGANLVTPKLADELGIKVEGKLPSTGAGEGVMEGGFSHVESIDIAGATVKNQTILVLPLDRLENVEGVALPAMIGFETFRRFVTRIDYGAQTVTLIDPARFDAKDAGTEIPFIFHDNHPEVAGTFEGIAANFDIDTGARDDLTLCKPFAERNDLRTKHPKGVDTVTGWGVGGPSTGYVTRGREITIGPVNVENLVVTLADQNKGAFAGDNYQGNLGGGILRRFVVTFDYSHQKMYLKPLAAAPADIGAYDRAGLWLNTVPEGFVVANITKGSPADQVGVLKDDIVVAVDGRIAKTIALPDLRARLRTGKPGAAVTLKIKHGEKTRTVKLILRDLI